MKCPVCKTSRLELQVLEPELFTLSCGECEGTWIQSFRYWQWRNRHARDLPEIPPAESEIPHIVEASVPKGCPECGHILIPHRVLHGLNFHLDRCGNCGGIWLDAHEWDSLRARNLHLDTHRIFNAVWQREVTEAEKVIAREKRLQTLIGTEDLETVRQFQRWLDRNPHRDTILALLTQEQT